MNFDAVAVGPHDLSAGVDFLTSRSPSTFPWISANILDKERVHIFLPYITKQVGSLNVALLGLTGDSPPQANMIVAPWQDVLPDLLTTLSKNTDVTILLSSLTEKENREIAKRFPQINIIITAYVRQGNRTPEIVHNSLFTQTDRQGKYLGVLSCSIGNSGNWRKDYITPRTTLQKALSSVENKIANIAVHDKNTYPKNQRALESLERRREEILKQLQSLNRKFSVQQNSKLTDSSWASRFVALKKNLPEDKEINRFISNTKRQINNFNRTNRKKNLVTKKDLKPLFDKMSGHVTCEKCHTSQAEFWKTTDHFNSYATLVEQGQAYNLECLPCHVTHLADQLEKNIAERSPLLSLPPSFLVVGCESCHGPSLNHAQDPENTQPASYPHEALCIECHTNERDNNFQYEKKRMLVRCPAD